ncbi:MAG: hypothetical protein KGR48_01930 [Alphaproteobacteria bacterium]|nr:hypothetical protein [Alphaproteobacteria bacterium]MDE2350951.1 hypothetical protein [Alphaproteobacteria bacterium]
MYFQRGLFINGCTTTHAQSGADQDMRLGMQPDVLTEYHSQNHGSRHIRSLAELFACKCAQDRGLPFRPLSAEAEALLAAYDWHSDLSAMEATIRRAAIMAEGDEIGAEVIRLPEQAEELHTGKRPSEAAMRALLGHSVAEVERELILITLACCLGNRTRAAEILDISVRTLRNKLREYTQAGIVVPLPGEVPAAHEAQDGHAGARRQGEPQTAGGF